MILLFKIIKKLIKWLLIIVGCSVLLTIVLAVVPIQYTPLMIKRSMEGMPVRQHEWVNLDDMSPNLIDAVIASEDNLFRGHYGFSITGIQQALEERESGKRIRGGSTISQQTAKNIFTTGSRTWFRKGVEAYFTVLIEAIWGKERIMEVYLNSIEMGPGIYGAEAAADIYFNKNSSQLTKEEAALIAISLPNPLERDPSHPTSYMRQRQQSILRLMRLNGPQPFDSASLREARQRYKEREKSIQMQETKKKMVESLMN